MAKNSLGALAASSLMGANVEKTLEGMGRLAPSVGRGKQHNLDWEEGGKVTILDESYNANPTSMASALAVLGKFDVQTGTQRRIAVLGDMLELGKRSQKYHEELAKPIASANVDLVFLVGSEMENLAKLLPKAKLGGHFPDTKDLPSALKETIKGGDTVMLKASLSIGFGAVVAKLVEQNKD